MNLMSIISIPLSVLLLWGCSSSTPNPANASRASAQAGVSAELETVLVEFGTRLDSVRIAIDAGSLRLVHSQAEELVHCVKAANGLYATDKKWRKKKFKIHLQRIRNGIHWLHEYADAKNAVGAKDALNGLTRDFRSFETFLESESEGP